MSNVSAQSPAGHFQLIQAREVRRRLGGVSAMWLHRHRNHLPRPVYIGKRRFWVQDEIDGYIATLSTTRGATDREA